MLEAIWLVAGARKNLFFVGERAKKYSFRNTSGKRGTIPDTLLPALLVSSRVSFSNPSLRQSSHWKLFGIRKETCTLGTTNFSLFFDFRKMWNCWSQTIGLKIAKNKLYNIFAQKLSRWHECKLLTGLKLGEIFLRDLPLGQERYKKNWTFYANHKKANLF